MVKNLESFLEEYESIHPNNVVHIDKEIESKWEVTGLAVKIDKIFKEPPILIFHKVRTVKGIISEYSSVINLFASRKRCAFAVGSTFENIGMDVWKKGEIKKKPVLVAKEEAPVKQVIKTGEDIDLFDFPALVHHAWDPGPYLSAGYLTAYDPDSGVDNSSIHRGWISGSNEIRFMATHGQHISIILDKLETRNEEAKVAYWVGHHPAACFGIQRPMGFPESHFEAASGVLGESLRLVPSETLGDEFLVPADAEIVIEGIVPPGKRKPEGPFGEAYGHFGAQRLGRIMQVTGITCRKNAHWLSMLIGHKDFNVGLGGIQGEGVVFDAVRRAVPTVKTLCRSPSVPAHLYIQIKKTLEHQPRTAIISALSSWSSIKHVFVFDEDVDIFDESEIMWAIGSRSQWDKDVIIIPRCGASAVDPSTDEDELGTKGGIDCTKPAPPKPFEQRLYIPKNVMDKIDIEYYLPKKEAK